MDENDKTTGNYNMTNYYNCNSSQFPKDRCMTYFFAEFLRTRRTENVTVMATLGTSIGRHVVD